MLTHFTWEWPLLERHGSPACLPCLSPMGRSVWAELFHLLSSGVEPRHRVLGAFNPLHQVFFNMSMKFLICRTLNPEIGSASSSDLIPSPLTPSPLGLSIGTSEELGHKVWEEQGVEQKGW